jgi:hypothetical protein
MPVARRASQAITIFLRNASLLQEPYVVPLAAFLTLLGLGRPQLPGLLDRMESHHIMVVNLASSQQFSDVTTVVMAFWISVGVEEKLLMADAEVSRALVLCQGALLQRLRATLLPNMWAHCSGSHIHNVRLLARNMVGVWTKLEAHLPAALCAMLAAQAQRWNAAVCRQTTILHLRNTLQPMFTNMPSLAAEINAELTSLDPTGIYCQVHLLCPHLMLRRLHSGEKK